MRVDVASERPWGVSAAWVRRLLTCAWRQVRPRSFHAELSVALVGRRTSATLNARYRRKAGPTNVLAFSTAEARSGTVGDLIICVPVARSEAPRFGRTVRQHVALLLVHGLLHLLGYDHRRIVARERMERLERQILAHCLA